MSASGHAYASAEAANASSLRSWDASAPTHASAGSGASISSLHADVRNFLLQLMSELLPVSATWEDLLGLLVVYLSGRWGLTTLFLLILRLRTWLHL